MKGLAGVTEHVIEGDQDEGEIDVNVKMVRNFRAIINQGNDHIIIDDGQITELIKILQEGYKPE